MTVHTWGFHCSVPSCHDVTSTFTQFWSIFEYSHGFESCFYIRKSQELNSCLELVHFDQEIFDYYTQVSMILLIKVDWQSGDYSEVIPNPNREMTLTVHKNNQLISWTKCQVLDKVQRLSFSIHRRHHRRSNICSRKIETHEFIFTKGHPKHSNERQNYSGRRTQVRSRVELQGDEPVISRWSCARTQSNKNNNQRTKWVCAHYVNSAACDYWCAVGVRSSSVVNKSYKAAGSSDGTMSFMLAHNSTALFYYYYYQLYYSNNSTTRLRCVLSASKSVIIRPETLFFCSSQYHYHQNKDEKT